MNRLVLQILIVGGSLVNCTIACSHAQSIAETYFPYTVGDSVWFNSVASRPLTFHFTDSVSMDGTLYLIVDGLPIRGGVDTLRAADDAVFRYTPDGEQLLFDFSVPNDSSYEANEGRFPEPMSVYVGRDFTVSTNAGDFANAISFYFDHPQSFDEEYGYDLAPGVGIASYYGAWQRGILDGVSLSGVIVTDTGEAPGTNAGYAIYPNPANGIMVVEHRSLETGNPVITVHDLLGRRVSATIVHRDLGSTHLDLAGLASGRYFVRIHSGDRVDSRLVTVRH